MLYVLSRWMHACMPWLLSVCYQGGRKLGSASTLPTSTQLLLALCHHQKKPNKSIHSRPLHSPGCTHAKSHFGRRLSPLVCICNNPAKTQRLRVDALIASLAPVSLAVAVPRCLVRLQVPVPPTALSPPAARCPSLSPDHTRPPLSYTPRALVANQDARLLCRPFLLHPCFRFP